MMSMEVGAMELGVAAVWAREGVARGVVVIAMVIPHCRCQGAI